jgi:heat shock protein HslJ
MKFSQNLVIFVCLLSMSSCNLFKKSAEESKQTAVITDRRWKLVELDGKPVADLVNGKEPYILLQQKETRYSGTAGCNGIGGNFTLLDNGRIKFSQGMSTKMYCDNMEIENGLSKALIAADNYSLDGDNLSLNKAKMAPLARFKAVKPSN